MNMVVVDDDAGSRKSLRQLFEGIGYRVSEAASADAALEVIAEGRIILAVVSLNPADWQGLSLIKKIRRNHPGLSVIAVANNKSKQPIEPLAALAETWGAAAVVYRPYENRALMGLAQRLAPSTEAVPHSKSGVGPEAGATPLPVPRLAPRARPPSGRRPFAPSAERSISSAPRLG